MRSLPTLKPLLARSTPGSGLDPASPSRQQHRHPGWRATVVRRVSFERLRAIQRATRDPRIDMSYLTEAAIRLGRTRLSSTELLELARQLVESSSPHRYRRLRTEWRSTLIRDVSFAALRDLQKSTKEPAIDLSVLTEIALSTGLDQGAEAVVSAAWDVMRSG